MEQYPQGYRFPRLKRKSMNDRTLTILSVLCLIAIVGIMSWRDMHPVARDRGPAPLTGYAYDAGPDITAAMVPDDNSPVIIAQGEFKYSPDGKTTFTPEGMLPTTFAQRPVSLLLRLDGLPQNPVETLEKIAELEKAWKNQGTDLATVFLEHHEGNPDFKTYTDFLNALRTRFKDSFHPAVVIHAAWLDEPQRSSLQRMQEYTPHFLIDVPQLPPPPEFLSKLHKTGYAFILRFPAGALPADVDASALNKARFLSGYCFRLDAHKPWPIKEEKVGLFPKF